ncbi:MAG: helix-turn-helix transcriptional regulator [Desulfobacteraceae bacterium]
MNVAISEYNPSFRLGAYVELYWFGRFNLDKSPLLSQRVVPNGYVELIIHLTDAHCELLQGKGYESSPDYTLIGLFTQPYDVHFRETVRVFGIRFKPEGIYPVFGMPASEIQAAFTDMESFTGRNFREYSNRLRDSDTVEKMIRISESYLAGNVDRRRKALYYLNRAAEIIRRKKGLISIEELAGSAYIGARQLEREFRQKVGISPKQYMRIARLNEVNRILSSDRRRMLLTDVSYICGYTDQAHFIRDFKHFTGESPKKFLEKRERYIVNPNIADPSDE